MAWQYFQLQPAWKTAQGLYVIFSVGEDHLLKILIKMHFQLLFFLNQCRLDFTTSSL